MRKNIVSKTDTCCIKSAQFYKSYFFTMLKNRLLDFGMAFNNKKMKNKF